MVVTSPAGSITSTGRPEVTLTLGKAQNSFEVPITALQKDWGGKKMTTNLSDDVKHFYIDTGKNNSIYYTDRTYTYTAMGNYDKEYSWIADRPTITQFFAETQKRLFLESVPLPDDAPKGSKLMAHVVWIQFHDFAVLNNKVIGNTAWVAYCSTEQVRRSLLFSTVDKGSDNQRFRYIFDGQLQMTGLITSTKYTETQIKRFNGAEHPDGVTTLGTALIDWGNLQM